MIAEVAETIETNAGEELKRIAGQIRDWQSRRGMSDAALCREFAGLGSTKTFKKIVEGQLEELDVERQCQNYLEVWALIDTKGRDGAEDVVYDDLKHMVDARLAVKDAQQENGNNRLVIIEGEPGAGKTQIARCLLARLGNAARMAEADETWSQSLPECLAGLLRAVGTVERAGEMRIPYSCGERKQKLLDTLNARKIVLIIDESHHLGVRALNIVKTIINQSKTTVVLLANPTLLRRLESAAFEEAKQLTKNRLCERIKLGRPSPAEVLKFIERRGARFTDAKTAGQCAEKLAKDAVNYGYWNFVNLVARKCREACGGNEALDAEGFASCFVAAVRTR